MHIEADESCLQIAPGMAISTKGKRIVIAKAPRNNAKMLAYIDYDRGNEERTQTLFFDLSPAVYLKVPKIFMTTTMMMMVLMMVMTITTSPGGYALYETVSLFSAIRVTLSCVKYNTHALFRTGRVRGVGKHEDRGREHSLTVHVLMSKSEAQRSRLICGHQKHQKYHSVDREREGGGILSPSGRG